MARSGAKKRIKHLEVKNETRVGHSSKIGESSFLNDSSKFCFSGLGSGSSSDFLTERTRRENHGRKCLVDPSKTICDRLYCPVDILVISLPATNRNPHAAHSPPGCAGKKRLAGGCDLRRDLFGAAIMVVFSGIGLWVVKAQQTLIDRRDVERFHAREQGCPGDDSFRMTATVRDQPGNALPPETCDGRIACKSPAPAGILRIPIDLITCVG